MPPCPHGANASKFCNRCKSLCSVVSETDPASDKSHFIPSLVNRPDSDSVSAALKEENARLKARVERLESTIATELDRSDANAVLLEVEREKLKSELAGVHGELALLRIFIGKFARHVGHPKTCAVCESSISYQICEGLSGQVRRVLDSARQISSHIRDIAADQALPAEQVQMLLLLISNVREMEGSL